MCLDKALDLLKAVTKDPCPDPSKAHSKPVTQAILAKNKETIQATLAILACESCMEDRLLIMVALLIAMEMLPRYASAAALTGLTACLSDASMDASRSDGLLSAVDPRSHDQNFPRQAKLQVLRELHLVQRLITQLSARLKGLSSHGRSAGSIEALLGAQSSLQRPGSTKAPQKAGLSNHSSKSSVSSEAELMPISTRTLDLVEDDVRNGLSSLSAVVRNALKQS